MRQHCPRKPASPTCECEDRRHFPDTDADALRSLPGGQYHTYGVQTATTYRVTTIYASFDICTACFLAGHMSPGYRRPS